MYDNKEQLHSYISFIIVVSIIVLVINVIITLKRKKTIKKMVIKDTGLIKQIKQEALGEIKKLNESFNNEFHCNDLIEEINKKYFFLLSNSTEDK